MLNQLDQETEFSKNVVKWGLTSLENKILTKYEDHKWLLNQIIAFQEKYERLRIVWRDTAILNKDQVENKFNMKKKKQIFDNLKTLMQKLTFCPDGDLLVSQI